MCEYNYSLLLLYYLFKVGLMFMEVIFNMTYKTHPYFQLLFECVSMVTPASPEVYDLKKTRLV